jgi:3-isopropylmalate/(R)-2-methylmalate dehydratase small subunit
MEPLRKVEGVVAALDRADVDTDQIIPKQFLKRIERTGYGPFLFNDWRFRPDGSENPDFELNAPALKGAKILVAGRNFGCGSSREHAAWALHDYGFRAVVSSSFADIFLGNCFQTGIVPVQLPEERLQELMRRAQNAPYRATVDLESMTVKGQDGLTIPFQLDPFRRRCLMEGLDDIGLTLQHEADITRFERERATEPSWIGGLDPRAPEPLASR